MTKYSYIGVLLFAFALESCQTIEELSIDYMLPADISFPVELKRVAVVNNTSASSDNKMRPADESKRANEISRAVVYHDGDATLTIQTLAEAIAKENYFEQVVICDSALRTKDILSRENTLSQDEVQDLAEKLDVDFIVSLENIQMKATQTISYLTDWACYQGAIDIKVYPTIKVYLPSRKGPMVTVNASDSIFWEELGTTESYVRAHLAGNKAMITEASEFAGTVPLKHLLPYWKTGKRYLYTNGSVNMRDATIYVRENSWNKAFKLWDEAYRSTKSEKKQLYAALNIALYYEMQDSIEEAEKWAIKAQELAYKIEKIEKRDPTNVDLSLLSNYIMTSLYVAELKERKTGLAKLNMQMERFNDDF